MIQPHHRNWHTTPDERGPRPARRLSFFRWVALAAMSVTLASSPGCALFKDEDDIRMERMMFAPQASDTVRPGTPQRVHGGITP